MEPVPFFPIWEGISAFGLPYPPFDYNSGMGLRDVGYREALDLGLLEPGQRVDPTPTGFDQDVRAAAPESPSLRRELARAWGDLIDFPDDGTLTLKPALYPLEVQAASLAGAQALDLVLRERRDFPNAMRRDDVGAIDFLWGDERAGIAHVLARAEAREKRFPGSPSAETVLAAIPEVIAKASAVTREGRKLVLEWTGLGRYEWRVTLGTDRKGKPGSAWVLSSYDVDPLKEGYRPRRSK
jgi:hypothetical protein